MYLDFPYIHVKGRGCRLRKQLEDILAVLFVPHNMANSESAVELLRSKHRVFSNISCVFKIKMDFTIDRGSFDFIDRIHTKELANGKNTFLFICHFSCRFYFSVLNINKYILLYNVPVFIRINVYSYKKVRASNFFGGPVTFKVHWPPGPVWIS